MEWTHDVMVAQDAHEMDPLQARWADGTTDLINDMTVGEFEHITYVKQKSKIAKGLLTIYFEGIGRGEGLGEGLDGQGASGQHHGRGSSAAAGQTGPA